MLIKKEFPIENPEYYDGITGSSVCFDIETTGLSRQYSHITVIGTGCIKNDKLIFRQWLLDDPSEESALLAEFSEYIRDFDSIIQFNGNAFDIPYVMERCRLYALPDPFTGMSVTDLYKSAKHLKSITDLENLKQKSLEKLFGIKRQDRISGRDCIFAYQDYLRYGDIRARDALLLHNEEDVINLMRLYPLHVLDDIADAAVVDDVSVSDEIKINFSIKSALPFDISYTDSACALSINKKSGSLVLRPLLCIKKLYFSDYKNYYYLPDEDRAIHKSVGAYVDAAHRQKATKANCYEKANDCFYLQYADDILPSFKDKPADKTSWFRARDFEKGLPDSAARILRSYLCAVFNL